jgi:hypothetical protein
MITGVAERLIEWIAKKVRPSGCQAEEQASKGAESPYSRGLFVPILLM